MVVQFGMGHILGCIGIALATLVPGIGSILGITRAGQTAAGLAAEQPQSFFKAFILQIMPSTQGIYGFVVAFLIFSKLGIGGTLADISPDQGWMLLIASLPIAILGYISAVQQSKMASASIVLLGKQPNSFGRGMMMIGVMETYVLLGMVMSIFLIG